MSSIESFKPEVGQSSLETFKGYQLVQEYENPYFRIPREILPPYYNMFPVGVFHTILIDEKEIAYQIGIAGPFHITPNIQIHDSIHVYPDLKSGLICCAMNRIKRIDENGYQENLIRNGDYYKNGLYE